MKVGILTFHCAPNYGAVLQAFGLYKTVELLGHDPVIIDYVPQWRRDLYVPARHVFLTLRPWVGFSRARGCIIRQKTNNFVRRNMRVSAPYFSVEALQANPPKCDAFITGSDQVWNPRDFEKTGGFDSGYFLDFPSPGAIKVAYAPSCGAPVLSKRYMEAIRPCLEDFSSIAMREQATADLLAGELQRQIPCVCDPTLLAPREVFDSVVSSPRTRRLLCFFLSNYPDRRRTYEIIKGLTRSRGAFLNPPFTRLFNGVYNFSVEGWVSSFSEAEFVLTDSFHGTVFAILYRKPFITIAGGLGGRIDRIISLLDKLGLQDRLVADHVTCESVRYIFETPIAWDRVDSRLREWKKDSLAYLENALHDDT